MKQSTFIPVTSAFYFKSSFHRDTAAFASTEPHHLYPLTSPRSPAPSDAAHSVQQKQKEDREDNVGDWLPNEAALFGSNDLNELVIISSPLRPKASADPL